MKRVVSWTRVYKVVKFLVLTITVISALIFTWSFLRFNDAYNNIRHVELDCIDIQTRTGISYTDCGEDFDKDLYLLEALILYPLIISIFLPSLFFGGKRIIDYIFPFSHD